MTVMTGTAGLYLATMRAVLPLSERAMMHLQFRSLAACRSEMVESSKGMKPQPNARKEEKTKTLPSDLF
jgi:hypothetical protein